MYNPAYPNQGGVPPQVNQQMMGLNNPMGGPNMGMMMPQGIRKLENLPAIYIKQQFEKWEMIFGFETPNTYNVYAADVNGDIIPNIPPIFKCKEKSSCFQRVCCPGDARGFEMKICQFAGGIDEKGKPKMVETMHFFKPYQFTYGCIGRPNLQVATVDPQQQKTPLGRIHHPWFCTKIGVDIFNKEDLPKYSVRGSALQLGVICNGCPYRACKEVKMNIHEYHKEQELKPLYKEYAPGCQALTDCAYFRIIFPDGASCEEKALIMAAAIFIDYRYFEISPTGDQNSPNNYLL